MRAGILVASHPDCALTYEARFPLPALPARTSRAVARDPGVETSPGGPGESGEVAVMITMAAAEGSAR